MRTTALARIAVGVMVERRRARSAWADFLWRSVSVFTGSPSAAPWTPLGIEAETTLFYAGQAAIDEHRRTEAQRRRRRGVGDGEEQQGCEEHGQARTGHGRPITRIPAS